ncbi:MAG: hypothetical protein HY791_33325 [Deltaproteobacteria bacterium]|nr:hypothetical protein [Deltaproteobacteria bacterium]
MSTERLTCVDGLGPRLVDAAFLRTPDRSDRANLERHLVQCPPCRERYERLWLVERVVAHGPECVAPSPSEVERVAAALFEDQSVHSRGKWPMLIFGLSLGAAVSLVGVVVPAWLSKERPSELVARGGEMAGASATVFSVSNEGEVRGLRDRAIVFVGDQLKVRVSLRSPTSGPVSLVWFADKLDLSSDDGKSPDVWLGNAERIDVLRGPLGAGTSSVMGSAEVRGPPGLRFLSVVLGEVDPTSKDVSSIAELVLDVRSR